MGRPSDRSHIGLLRKIFWSIPEENIWTLMGWVKWEILPGSGEPLNLPRKHKVDLSKLHWSWLMSWQWSLVVVIFVVVVFVVSAVSVVLVVFQHRTWELRKGELLDFIRQFKLSPSCWDWRNLILKPIWWLAHLPIHRSAKYFKLE